MGSRIAAGVVAATRAEEALGDHVQALRLTELGGCAASSLSRSSTALFICSCVTTWAASVRRSSSWSGVSPPGRGTVSMTQSEPSTCPSASAAARAGVESDERLACDEGLAAVRWSAVRSGTTRQIRLGQRELADRTFEVGLARRNSRVP